MSSHGDLKSRVVVIDEECSDCGDNVDNSTENPGSFFCGFNKQDAAQKCIPCPSGTFTECDDPFHGCIKAVTGCTLLGVSSSQQADSQNGMSFDYASKFAPNLRLTISMERNFDHFADCSMGDWGLCHAQTLVLEYIGEEDYLSKCVAIVLIHDVLSL